MKRNDHARNALAGIATKPVALHLLICMALYSTIIERRVI